MSDYAIEIPGFSNQKLVWRTGTWTSKFLVNDEVVKGTGKKKAEYSVEDDRGETQTIVAKTSFGDVIPSFSYQGEIYNIAPPLTTAQKIFAAILHVPLFAGGALGGACCGVGFILSLSIFRSEKPIWLRYLMVTGVATVAWIVYLTMAIGIGFLLN